MNMLKEDLEKAVLYSNICLERWARNKTHLMNTDSIRSMINGWLIRVLCRTSHSEWRMRKSLAKQISKNLFVTIDPIDHYITSITIQGVMLPQLDFRDLEKQAHELVHTSSFLHNIDELNLETIESIKFS